MSGRTARHAALDAEINAALAEAFEAGLPRDLESLPFKTRTGRRAEAVRAALVERLGAGPGS